MKENTMRKIKIEKVVINIGCGGDIDKIEKAKVLLKRLTGRKPVITKSKKRSTFGIAKGKPIGVKVTLRGKEAVEFFKKALAAKDNRISSNQIDQEGNLSIGIAEYIELPGVKYMHDVGMLGFDVCATLERPGFRIKRRKIQKRKIPKSHRISKEEAMEWLKKEFGVEIV